MVIITESQLYELTGGGYLDSTDDYMPDGKIAASSAIDEPDGGVDYSEPETGDEHSASMARDSLYGGLFGTSYAVLPDVIRETNSYIANRTYRLNQNIDISSMPKDSMGRNAIINGVNGSNVCKYARRAEKAINAQKNGNPYPLQKIGGIEVANEFRRLYQNQRKMSKNVRDAKPEGQKIKSAPKESGNGKAHTKKGVLNYFE